MRFDSAYHSAVCHHKLLKPMIYQIEGLRCFGQIHVCMNVKYLVASSDTVKYISSEQA